MSVAPVTAKATSEKIGAGSVFEFSLDAGTSWAILRGLASIPQLGSEAPAKDQADISETAPRYMDTFPENTEMELAMAQLLTNSDQAAFIAATRDRETIDIRITYSTGLIATTKLKQLADYAAEATKEDAAGFATKGRISGAIAWSEVAG